MTVAIRQLREVCEITMGQAPDGASYNENGLGLPLIAGAGDFGPHHPQAKKFTSAPTKICADGDIVLSIRATIGTKVLSDGRFCLGRGVAGLRPTDALDNRYLWHWLGRAEDVLAAKGRGATFPQVSRNDIGELEIPLPSLNEQRRIAGILDKADALRRKRKRALDLLDSLTLSIFLEMFGDPVGSTRHKIEAMGDVIRGIESGWSPTCLDRASIDGEPGVLKLSAITGSEFNPEENKALPPGLSPKAGTEVVAEDILLCRKNTRELVGSSVYIWSARPNLHMSDLIFRLMPEKSKIDPIFLQAQLSVPSLRHKISEMSGVSCTRFC